MRSDFRVGKLAVCFLELLKRLFVVTTFVEDPPETIDNGRAIGIVAQRLTNQFFGLAKFIGAIRQCITQRIQR